MPSPTTSRTPSAASAFAAGVTRHSATAPEELVAGTTSLQRATEHAIHWACPICRGWIIAAHCALFSLCRQCGLTYAPEAVPFATADIDTYRAQIARTADYLLLAREETGLHAENERARRRQVDEQRFLKCALESAAATRYEQEADALAAFADEAGAPKFFTLVLKHGERYLGQTDTDHCQKTAWPDVAGKLAAVSPATKNIAGLHQPRYWPGTPAAWLDFQGDPMLRLMLETFAPAPTPRFSAPKAAAYERIAAEVCRSLHETGVCDVQTVQVTHASTRVLFTVKPDAMAAWLDLLAKLLPELAQCDADVAIGHQFMMVEDRLCAAWVMRIDASSDRLMRAGILEVRTVFLRVVADRAGQT